MSAARRALFFVAHQLGTSVAALEHLSNREVQGWFDYFAAERGARPAANDDAIPLGSLTRDDLRRMFPRA
jgi:hypothetical protein